MKAFSQVSLLLFLSLPIVLVQGQDKKTPDPKRSAWREWCVFSPDEDADVHALAFAPDRLTVAAGLSKGKVRLWDAVTGRDETLVDAREVGPVLALHFDGQGKRLRTAGERGVAVWNLADGKRLGGFAWKTAAAVAVTFSANGAMVASVDSEGQVRVWAVDSGTMCYSLSALKAGAWTCAAFSAEGKSLATGATDGSVLHWRTTDGEALATVRKSTGEMVRALALAPDGSALAASVGRAGVIVLELPTGKVRAVLRGQAPPYHTLAFSPQGDVLAAGSANGTLHIWDVAKQTTLATFKDHAGLIGALAFSADGLMLATAGADTLVRTWDSQQQRALPEIKLEADELKRFLGDLRGDDELTASRAALTLSAAPKQTLPTLQSALPQGKPPDLKRIGKLLSELNSEQFTVRDNATRELAALGQPARGELRRFLEKPPDLETKRRVESLLARLAEQTADEALRRLARRGIALLERIGGPQAREILTGLVHGLADDQLIAEARAALERTAK